MRPTPVSSITSTSCVHRKVTVPPGQLSSYFTTNAYSQLLNPNTALKLLTPAPNRTTLVFGGLTAGASYNIWIDSTVSTLKGILIPANQLPLILTFRDLGPIISREWWAISGAGGTVNILETLFGQSVDLSTLGS